MFRGEILHMSTFTIGEPREPYCMIPGKCLKLLRNKVLGVTINNWRIEICKREDVEQLEFLFSVDKKHYHIYSRLTTTKA